MDRVTFPARIVANQDADPDDWGWTVLFRDLPEAITFGDTAEAAWVWAADCLWTALAQRMRSGEAIPPPSAPKPGERLARIDDLLVAKAALYLALQERRMTPADLARQLDVGEGEIRRLLDPASRPSLARLERALAVLGKRLIVDVQDAA